MIYRKKNILEKLEQYKKNILRKYMKQNIQNVKATADFTLLTYYSVKTQEDSRY
jgi:hypothetical protein